MCADRAVMFLVEDDYVCHPEMLAEVVRPGAMANCNTIHVDFSIDSGDGVGEAARGDPATRH